MGTRSRTAKTLAPDQLPPPQSINQSNTTVLLFFWNMSGTNRVSRYQKGKTRKVQINLDLLEQEMVSSSGICWAICMSAPHPRQPCQHPTTQFFTGRMPFLPPNQQRQSTEGINQSKHLLFVKKRRRQADNESAQRNVTTV